ncbi:hypothetical protein B9Z19DRAFT_1060697 [Tuber borchii]|uniref:DUF6987 domain-containing protein n=1 Tax=Tuber borchii TaxID=42251 RepID=A0A2T7A7R0_TUBBO|nr:hypothetical protein B9Z19DRAFT_1060697 [Tuber borchii]
MSTKAAQRDLTNDLTNVPPEPINPEKVAAPRNEKVSADAAKEDIKSDGDSGEDAAKIAKKMSGIIDPAIDRLKPILQTITEHVDKANNTKKEDLDEEKLVDQLKPLIQQATGILQETHGAIKALDPGGKVGRNAQHKAADSEASPEEQHLARGLAELTGDVTKTIQNAKDKIKDMPTAQKNLGPLLDLLGDPLFQIISAVGLLLNGVLSLLGNLLDALGLGGIVRNILGGLGLAKVLEGLGLGKWLKQPDSK